MYCFRFRSKARTQEKARKKTEKKAPKNTQSGVNNAGLTYPRRYSMLEIQGIIDETMKHYKDETAEIQLLCLNSITLSMLAEDLEEHEIAEKQKITEEKGSLCEYDDSLYEKGVLGRAPSYKDEKKGWH